MKSKFFLVQTDVFLSICVILIINTMQSVSVFSAAQARAGHSQENLGTLEIHVSEDGRIAVVSGDTSCERALVMIHPAAPAGTFEMQLGNLLANSEVKSVARIISSPNHSPPLHPQGGED